MSGKRSFLLFCLFIGTGLLLCLMLAHASYARRQAGPSLTMKSEMVKRFGLTDLCIFTDARYTRHPAMADLHTPFQSHPLSFEHFPSGSLMPPPPHLRVR